MRTTSTGQRLRLRSKRRLTRVRVEIQDDVGTWQDWTNIFGRDLIQFVEWGEELDSPGLSANIGVYWRRYFDNASPYMAGSRLENWLSEGRGLRIYTEVLGDGEDVAGSDEQLMFDGVIDGMDIESNPGTLRARDKTFADLVDEFVQETNRYGTGNPSMETLIQTIINDHMNVPVTLYTPSSPGFAMRPYDLQSQNIHTAIKNIWVLIGWDCRPKWRDATSQFELTLYDPNRTKTTPDDTIERTFYRTFPTFGRGREDVRNKISVWYYDGTTGSGGERIQKNVVVTDGTSANDYGEKWMEVAEGVTSGIDTLTEATDFANRILSDLKDPVANVSVRLPYYWPVELNDLLRLKPDGERFGNDSDLAVMGYMHRVEADDATTELTMAGRPRTGTQTWIDREARPGQAISRDTAAPDTPTATYDEGPLWIDAILDWNNSNDWDVVELHEGDTSGFIPSLASLVGQSRSTRVARRKGKGSKFYKMAVRDKSGNRSTFSAAAAASPTGVAKQHLADELQHACKVTPNTDRTPSPSPATIEFDTVEWGLSSMWDAGNDLMTVSHAGVYEVRVVLVPGSTVDLTSWRIKIIKDPSGTPVVIADSGVLTDTTTRVDLREDITLAALDGLSVEVTYVGSTLDIQAAGSSFSIRPTTILT